MVRDLNLPPFVLDIIESVSNYEKKGDISVTQLLKPIQQFVLYERYKGRIEQSMQQNYAAILGSMFHKFFETELKYNPRFVTEMPVSIMVGDYKLTGTIDLYDKETETIYDFKFLNKPYSIALDKYKQQLHWYRVMCEQNNIIVSNEALIIFYKNYDIKAETIDCTLHDRSVIEILSYGMDEKVKKYMGLIGTKDKALPHCTNEECGVKKVFHVWNQKLDKSVCSFNTEYDAKQKIESYKTPENYHIVPDITRPYFCDNYCQVRQFCNQYNTQSFDVESVLMLEEDLPF